MVFNKRARSPYSSTTYRDDSIHVSWFSESSNPLASVLLIPGGPGLSNQYLFPFLLEFTKTHPIEIGLLDLPNHDRSHLDKGHPKIDFRACREIVGEVINEIYMQQNLTHMWGHSLGSRLSLELLPIILSEAKHKSASQLKGMLLSGFPVEFRSSNEFNAYLGRLDPSSFELQTEESFQEFLRKILPLYFYDQSNRTHDGLFTTTTYWLGNEHFLEGTEPPSGLAKKYRAAQSKVPVMVLKGERDLVLADDNDALIKKYFPEFQSRIIPKSGHFPNLENSTVFSEELATFFLGGIKP